MSRRARVVLIVLAGLLFVGLAAAWSATGSSLPQNANALVNAGLAAERAGNTNQAFSDYKAAAAKDPNNLYAHYDLGYIYQIRGDTADAATEYQKALLINPKFGTALYNLGVLKAATDPASAIEYYMQDLKVQPNNASANFNLGVLLIKQGQTSQGDLYLTTGLRLNPALSADVPAGITVPSTTTTTAP
jgi:tetratricopeptide (TPR) repeat protein